MALSWQPEPWHPSSQERVCFQCPDECMFLSIVNQCKEQLIAKVSLVTARQSPSLYSWTAENIFSSLAMACAFSLGLPVRRDLFSHPALHNEKWRSCLGREGTGSGLGKPMRLNSWGHVPSCAVFCNPAWNQLLASAHSRQQATETHENDLVSAFPSSEFCSKGNSRRQIPRSWVSIVRSLSGHCTSMLHPCVDYHVPLYVTFTF